MSMPSVAQAGPQFNERGSVHSVVRSTLKFLLVLFVASCIFDPADRLLGLKLYLFACCWLVAILLSAMGRERTLLSPGLLAYSLAFIAVPLISITIYWATRGGDPFEGWQLLKGYLLITLALLLQVHRVDLMPAMCALLTALSIAIIGTFVVILVEPAAFAALYVFGEATGVVIVAERNYGGDLTLLQAYFVTSPMLVMSIAYYFHRARFADVTRKRVLYGTIVAVNVVGMIFAGSRNNLAIAVLAPLVMHFMYSRHKVWNGLLAIGFLTLIVVVFSEQIAQLLDPTEFSNQLKLALAAEYSTILNDPLVAFLGQGLGAYQYWSARDAYFYISELTYFEILRNFGIFGAMVMYALLLFPIVDSFVVKREDPRRHLIVAYALYLLMCASNPNLFSSMGILILSIILANIFRIDSRSDE
jgi:hypothetical protein